ncbi:MAG: hypothetical protein K9K67_11505 [Bacteriovoracaceae bacterium]|nr:hypothetical protein [Bacteriovoracaceae bacterium]
MNLAQIHLALNHLPLMTIPVALIFYIYSIIKKNEEFKKFSLLMVLVTAFTVIPVFLTGEPAEEVVEHLPGVSEKLIESHEETAEVAFVLTLVAGAFSLLNLLFTEKLAFFKKHGPNFVIGICILALGLLLYTANKGGKIRHTELRGQYN